MSRRRPRYKYAKPNAGRVRQLLRRVALKVAVFTYDMGESVSLIARNAADSLSRPRCVYPGCRGDVANWCVGEYVPVDSWLCEEHHQDQSETIQRFYKSAEYERSGLDHVDDAEAVSKEWAKWHAKPQTPWYAKETNP